MKDTELDQVLAEYQGQDPDGQKTADVLRATFDQLYDGQRTGRYRWDQLHKTERTHGGTLVEINLQRRFGFADGQQLDYRIADIEVDCKYSQSLGGWMIPPEAVGQICLLAWASDEKGVWSLGLVRATADKLNGGKNRDLKSTLSAKGRDEIRWLFERAELPPNILLQMPREVVDRIMAIKSGTKRLNELFRQSLGMRVTRGVVATVAQQDDYMKRVRENGGARTKLRPEGIVILGQYGTHVQVAKALGVSIPRAGESVAIRIAPAKKAGPGVVSLGGGLWRLALDSDPIVPAPLLPKAN